MCMDREYNFRPLKWNNTVVLRNCDTNGELINLKKSAGDIPPWLLLTLKPFTFQGQVYPIFSCSSCSQNILKMSLEQNLAEFSDLLCPHSKVARCLCDNWGEIFEISNNTEDIKQSYKTKAQTEIDVIHKKDGKGSTTQHVIGVFIDGEVSLLSTVGKQTVPRGSNCSSANCKCIQIYTKLSKISEAQVPEVIDQNDNSISRDDSEDILEVPHYEQRDAKYGCNTTQIIYPLHLDPTQSEAIEIRSSPDFTFPSHLIPPFSPDNLCPHSYIYKENDECLKLCLDHVILYEESKETLYDTKVYYRESTGHCKCRQH